MILTFLDKSLKHISIFSLLIVFTINALSAQTKQTYKGTLQLNSDLLGEADYQYLISKKDTLKHGSFFFNYFNVDTLNDNLKKSLTISGNYNNGLKNGKWVYSYKSLKAEKSFEVKNYDVVFLSTGKELLVNGNFNNGKANGVWSAAEYSIKKSEVADTITFMQANYQNGRAVGAILGKSGKIGFSGSLNQEGLAHGEWILTHKYTDNSKLTEHRFFDNGLLKDHYLVIEGDTVTMLYIGIDNTIDEGETWEISPLNSRYFRTIKSANMGIDSSKCRNGQVISFKDTTDFFINQSNVFLEHSLSLLLHHNKKNIWELTEGSDPISLPSVKLRKYPMDKQEEKNLKISADYINTSLEFISDFFDNADIAIDRHTVKQLSLYYEVMSEHKSKVNYLNNLVQQFTDPSFKYINRKEIFDVLSCNILYPLTIHYEYKDFKFEDDYKFPELADEEDYSLVVREILEEIVDDLTAIAREIEEILTKSKKQTKLSDKEKNLVTKRDSIIALYSNENKDEAYNQYHTAISENVILYVNNAFRNYAKLEFENKIDTIDFYLTCFEAIVNLYGKQSEIPKKLERLDETYTRVIWNPYTFTDMEERVKERLYKTFETILMPFYLSDLESSINCNSLPNKFNNFELIYRRMMILRDQDTKELEKELRKVSDPRKVIDILGLEIDFN
jgi:hypothetical protein